jgi:hypothetical protein
LKLSSKYHLPSPKELELLEEKIASRRQSLKIIKRMKKEATDRFHATGKVNRFNDDMRKLIGLQRETQRDVSDLWMMFLKFTREMKEIYEFLASQKAQAPMLTDEELAIRYAWFCVCQNRYPSEFKLSDAAGWELTEIETWLSLPRSQ